MFDNPVFEERRAFPRARLALPIRVENPDDPLEVDPQLRNLRTTDVAPGGLYFKAFEAIPFSIGDRAAFRILVGRPHGADPTPVSILGPTVRVRGTILRIERVFVEGIAGWGVAVRFDGAPDLDGLLDLTVHASVS